MLHKTSIKYLFCCHSKLNLSLLVLLKRLLWHGVGLTLVSAMMWRKILHVKQHHKSTTSTLLQPQVSTYCVHVWSSVAMVMVPDTGTTFSCQSSVSQSQYLHNVHGNTKHKHWKHYSLKTLQVDVHWDKYLSL